MNRHVIERNDPYGSFGRKLNLTMDTYVNHTWNGLSGQTMVCNRTSSSVSNTYGSMLFLIPTVKSGFTYWDCLDVYFEGVGSFQGRELNARLHVTRVTFGSYTENKKYNISYSSNPAGLFLIPSYGDVELFFGRSDQQEYFPGLEQRFDGVKDIELTMRITYADTGEIVPFPFYLYVNDLDNNDLWNSYGSQEGITFGSGFTDDLYVYDGFRSEVRDRTVQVPNDGKNHNYSDFYVPPPVLGATSGEKVSNDPRVYEASNFLEACWGETIGGQFTMTFHGANATAFMYVRSPYLSDRTIPSPKKYGYNEASDETKLTWVIREQLPEIGKDVLHGFHSLVIRDTLVTGQSYTGAKVFDQSGNDISSLFSIRYDTGTREVVASANPSFLTNSAYYGKNIQLKIFCDWGGADELTNEAIVLLDNIPIPTPEPVKIKKRGRDGGGVDLYKYVVNPKESYGPGDEIEFIVIMDPMSFDEVDANEISYGWFYEPLGYEYSGDQDGGYWDYVNRKEGKGERIGIGNVYEVVSDFSFVDQIPKGLELIGEPTVYIRDVRGDSFVSFPQINRSTVLSLPNGLTEEHLKNYLVNEGHIGSFTFQGGTYKNCIWPSVSVKGDTVNNGKWSHDSFLTSILEGTEPIVPFDKLYCNNFLQWSGDIDYYLEEGGVVPEPGCEFLVSHMFSDYEVTEANKQKGYGAHWEKSKFSFIAPPNHYIRDIAYSYNPHNGLDYDIRKGLIFNRKTYRYDDDDRQYFGMTAFRYKCRVTGDVIGDYVTNTSNVSFRYANLAECSSWILYPSSVPSSQRESKHRMGIQVDQFRDPVGADASATVYISGYQVTTEVVNGVIDPSLYDLSPGSTVSIAYQPTSGYYLKSIEIDGTSVPIAGKDVFYTFSDLNASHHIKVTYEKGFDIITEVVHGLIDAPIMGIVPGETKTVHYEPETGYMLSTIEVDGHLVDSSHFLDAYLFTDVRANHHIKVTYIPAWKITTSIEHGTITPTITGITPGSEKTITYTPDSGYYVKSVTVDGRMLPVSELKQHLSSYTFSNIHADHMIYVVCVPHPTITVTKRIENVNKIVWAKGHPEFQFMISGTDYLGNSKTYFRSIGFDQNDGSIKSFDLKIPAGRYVVSELESNNWSLVSVVAGDGCIVQGNIAVLDSRNESSVSCRFVNRMDDWSMYTENSSVLNPLN